LIFLSPLIKGYDRLDNIQESGVEISGRVEDSSPGGKTEVRGEWKAG
jgi:hypothetical protein